MSGIHVVTDSACDLPEHLVKELEIDIVPLTIRFGSEEFVDRVDLSPEEFWARCASSPVLPETAAPSPGAFAAAYQRAADAGASGVVCINLSSALSATYQSAVTAAADAPVPVSVIDSRSLTLGQGILVLTAARAAREGKSLEEITALINDLIPRTRTYGTLDTLEYLKRGGRIGSAQALFGSLLSIKPVIVIANGAVEPESRQRTRARALQYLVDKVRDAGPIENLAVMNGAAPDIDRFLDMLGAVYPRAEIVVGDLGAVIGTHGGPGTVGVTFHVRG